jgi:hypothetical protein
LEYLVGILLALTAIHLPTRDADAGLVLAVAVVALPLLSDGPLGGFRVLGRGLHRALDVLLIMVLAASPAVLGWGDATTVVLAEVLAVIYAALVVRTSYTRRPSRRTGAPGAPVAPAGGPSPVVADAVRAAGRAVGKVGHQGPRALGRAVGRRSRR